MKIEVYRSVFAGSAKPEWRWRLRARNGRILASSSESYTKRPWCIRIARRCCRVGTPIVVKNSNTRPKTGPKRKVKE